MDFDHVGFRHWSRRFSQYGRGSVLATAAIVTGLAFSSKLQTWKKLHAQSDHKDNASPQMSGWDTNWDRRGPSQDTSYSYVASKGGQDLMQRKAKSKKDISRAKRHILLIRHGQYYEEGETDKDRFLTDLGKFQADKTGERLNELKLPFNTVISSTLRRAVETSMGIHKNLPRLELRWDDLLREGAPVHPSPPTESWEPLPSHFFQDGARIENAFRKYFYRADVSQKEDSYDVIVCHSNVIRYFVCRALQFPLNGWIRLSLANCSMTMVTIYPDGFVVLEMMGDHGHIPAESVSYS